MYCKFCGYENEEDAVFCIHCGKKLNGKLICPSCGIENEEDARFCKECGEELLKTSPKKSGGNGKAKGLSIGNLVLRIVAVCMSAFIILFSFGACFSSLVVSLGEKTEGAGLIDFIKGIKEFKSLPSGMYGADFYMLGKIFPDIILLCGACLSLIGCSVALIYGTVKAIIVGMKKEIPNLDNLGLLATCSLLIGMAFGSLCFMSSTRASVSGVNYSIGYGSVFLAAASIGIIWYFLNHIGHFVLDCIEGLSKKDILNRAFKLGETALFCVIIFNLGSTFLTFPGTGGGWSYATSIVGFFSELSAAIYNATSNLSFIFSKSKVAGGYYYALALSIIFIIIVAAAISLIFVRLRNTKKQAKASLVTAIPLVSMAIAELVLTIVSIDVFSRPSGVFSYIYINSDPNVGASIIVFTVFSILLLALEITWMVLNKTMKDEKEQPAYDL